MSAVIDDTPLILNEEGEGERREGEREGGREEDPLRLSRCDSLSLATEIQKMILRMKGQYMDDSGNVDYERLSHSEIFNEYKRQVKRLKAVDLYSFTETERKVFFLNIYNALTIHGLTHHKPQSVLRIPGFWRNTQYRIGKHLFSLDIIEHAMLRSNAPHPTTGVRYLQDDDCRISLIMSSIDPRIHFALNCGAQSCPPIRYYTVENLDEALNTAALNFCSSEVEVVDNGSGKRVIRMSKIFEWYGKDFGETNTQMLGRLLKYLPEEAMNAISEMISKAASDGGAGVEIVYKPYDWSLNECGKKM